MSTVITSVLIIVGVILVCALFVFILVSLVFPKKADDSKEDPQDYSKDIAHLEARQRALYKKLLALDIKEEMKEEVKEAPVVAPAPVVREI